MQVDIDVSVIFVKKLKNDERIMSTNLNIKIECEENCEMNESILYIN